MLIIFSVSCFQPEAFMFTGVVTKKSFQTIYMAGFGKPQEKKLDKVTISKYGKESSLKAPEDGTAPCACGSGMSYSTCCQPAHNSYGPELTAMQVERARFSAVVYGLVPFIMESTHPDMKDYVAPDEINSKIGRSKRDIWLKNLNIYMATHEISNFLVVSEESEGNKATFTTTFDQRIRGTKSNQVVQITRKVCFQQSSSGWQHLSSDEFDSQGEVVLPVVQYKAAKEKAVIVNRAYSLMASFSVKGRKEKMLAENRKIDFL
jgi:uncharacterized protein YchJ